MVAVGFAHVVTHKSLSDPIQLVVCRFSQEAVPAPAGLAPVERRIDHYGLASNRPSPFFRTFRRPALRAGRRKVRKNGETGAAEAAFLVANPSLHRGKPGGGD